MLFQSHCRAVPFCLLEVTEFIFGWKVSWVKTSRNSSALEKSITGQTWSSLFFEKCLGLLNQNEDGSTCTQWCPLRGTYRGKTTVSMKVAMYSLTLVSLLISKVSFIGHCVCQAPCQTLPVWSHFPLRSTPWIRYISVMGAPGWWVAGVFVCQHSPGYPP